MDENQFSPSIVREGNRSAVFGGRQAKVSVLRSGSSLVGLLRHDAILNANEPDAENRACQTAKRGAIRIAVSLRHE